MAFGRGGRLGACDELRGCLGPELCPDDDVYPFGSLCATSRGTRRPFSFPANEATCVSMTTLATTSSSRTMWDFRGPGHTTFVRVYAAWRTHQRRTILEVEHLGDYATFNYATRSADGPFPAGRLRQ